LADQEVRSECQHYAAESVVAVASGLNLHVVENHAIGIRDHNMPLEKRNADPLVYDSVDIDLFKKKTF